MLFTYRNPSKNFDEYVKIKIVKSYNNKKVLTSKMGIYK